MRHNNVRINNAYFAIEFVSKTMTFTKDGNVVVHSSLPYLSIVVQEAMEAFVLLCLDESDL